MYTRDTKARKDVSLTLYYDLQCPATHREVYHMPGTWKVTTNHRHTQELPPFPWHTLVTDMFYWKRMDF